MHRADQDALAVARVPHLDEIERIPGRLRLPGIRAGLGGRFHASHSSPGVPGLESVAAE